MASDVSWVFDALPPSGARRGGNPAVHAFRHDLSTFVREVVQNANDQASLTPQVGFRFVSLEGEAREAFLQALEADALTAHLRAATTLPDADQLRAALRSLEAGEALSVLYVDDFGTDGLTGGEDDRDGHFRALCKDTLFSNKREDAGGSYGLGKSVLWMFSSMSTVLFASTLIETNGHDNPRVIGRAELGSHAVQAGRRERWFQGPGWFGARRSHKGGRRAESIWGAEATARARALGFVPRDDHRTGTSICVVGFRDPTADEDLGPDELARAARRAIADSFWPSMALERRSLDAWTEVGHSRMRVRPADADVGAFDLAWRSYLRGELVDKPDKPGDVCAVQLPFVVPATQQGDPSVEAEVVLVVRLASTGAGGRVGHVAQFRGPGMVIRYRDRSRIAIAMRPFHAVLACGRLRDPAAPKGSDDAVEAFLRMAEPPAHDRWDSTPRLKAQYKRGYAKALRELESRVDDALRSLLVSSHVAGQRGPERLQRRFPIGKSGSRGKGKSAFGISGVDARPEAGCWTFRGIIERARGRGPWAAEVQLSEVDEGGRTTDRLLVRELDVPDNASTQIVEGTAVIQVPAEVSRIPFRGMSQPCSFLGALEVEVVGRITLEDAS